MFDKILSVVLRFEGGYVNDPKDAGGETNKGVTQGTYNTHRKSWHLSPQSVRYITDEEVRRIYESFYRDCSADKFESTHPRTSLVHFDFSINAGIKQGAKTLQRAVGGLLVDGVIGPKTLAGVSISDDLSLALDYLKEREKHYRLISDGSTIQRTNNKSFLKGWLWRNNKLKVIINDWPA